MPRFVALIVRQIRAIAAYLMRADPTVLQPGQPCELLLKRLPVYRLGFNCFVFALIVVSLGAALVS